MLSKKPSSNKVKLKTDLGAYFNTLQKDDVEYTAESVIQIQDLQLPLFKKLIMKSARAFANPGSYIEQGFLGILGLSTAGLRSDYKDSEIQNRIADIINNGVNVFSYKLDNIAGHIVSMQVENDHKSFHVNSDLKIKLKWRYAPSVDASIEDLRNIQICRPSITIDDQYRDEFQRDYLKSRFTQQFLVESDSVVDGAIIDTLWSSDNNQENDEIRMVFDKRRVKDLDLYHSLLGKCVNDSIEHQVKLSDKDLRVNIAVKKIQVFDLPNEINEDVVRSIGFDSHSSFMQTVSDDLTRFIDNLKYNYMLGQFSKYLLDMEPVKIPSRYEDGIFDCYIHHLSNLFRISGDDLKDEYGQIAFFNAFKQYFFIDLDLANYDELVEYIKSLAKRAASSCLRMISVLKKQDISELSIRMQAYQTKVSFDAMSLKLLFQYLESKHPDFFYTKEMISSYDDIEMLQKHANTSFWFINTTRER